MANFEFTPRGVEDKQAELYALTDSELANEAADVMADFRQWMEDNFIFSTAEQSFLDGIGNAAANEFGKQCNTAFLYRLPITLTPGSPIPGTTKSIRSENTFEVSATGTGTVSVSGSLSFIISYQ